METQLRTLFIRFVCYDDACHLTKFAKNPSRADLTPQAKQLASVQMVVDKMHMKDMLIGGVSRAVMLKNFQTWIRYIQTCMLL